MSFFKVHHVQSQSLIDISSIQSRRNRNQNRISSRSRLRSSHPHHVCCSSREESRNDEFFLHQTKQTLSELFHQTHFHDLLGQIQQTLRPIVTELRDHLQKKEVLTREERLNCMKSCAQFISQTLINERFHFDEHFIELDRLRELLNRSFSIRRFEVAIQTDDDPLEKDLRRLSIDPEENVPRLSSTLSDEKVPKIEERKTDRSSFVLHDRHHQKTSHRSASRAFRKLTSELHRMHDELPFQSHLRRYHQHQH